jgi:programmed cell death 6-interacting protein
MISIPFKRSHTVSVADALKQYISKEYDQHPDMFKQDLETIDRLRSDAVTLLEPHVSGIKKLSAYAAQLVWIGGKFPIDIGVEFPWFPALGFNLDRPVVENNIRFELANVLFNLAALYSQLAASLNRSTDEGLKGASRYFCSAAGVLDHLKTDIIPDMRTAPPEDMDPMTLDSLQLLMLAQAQECSWLVAVRNGYKDVSISRLAAKVSDFYDEAAGFGTRSDTISTDWIHHMSAKHHHFAAAAQYRAACDCLEKRKYGEEVARLKDSVNCVNEALKEKRWLNPIVLGDLNGLKMKVNEDLKQAEKDNDVIYLQAVPPKSELKALDRATMAKAKVPIEVSDPSSSLGDNSTLGTPLFIRLVPYSVHVAASLYVDRRDRVVNTNVIDELEALTNQVRDVLHSLNLPGALQALEKPLGVPPSVSSHAQEIRQQGGAHRVQRAIREIETLRENDVRSFEEGVSFLQTEAAEDERAKTKHGTERWTRVPSNVAAQALYNKVEEIKGYLNSANNSDELIRGKLKESESVLRVLEGTDRDLENYIPSSRKPSMAPKLEQDTSRLRGIINEVSRLESRRRKKAEALREKAKADDISECEPTIR